MGNNAKDNATILVPIDLHGIAPAVLKNLVSIARNLNRDLLGLVLGDARLSQAAALSFTTEIILDSGRERGLLPAYVEQCHGQITGGTRASLLQLANQAQVRLAFDEATGSRLSGLMSRYTQLDLFIPPRRRWRVTAPLRRAAIPRLAVLLTGGACDDRVLQTAQALVDAGLVAEVYELTAGDRASINPAALKSGPAKVVSRNRISQSASDIINLLDQSAYDLLILPRDCLQPLSPALTEQALGGSPSQLLLVS